MNVTPLADFRLRQRVGSRPRGRHGRRHRGHGRRNRRRGRADEPVGRGPRARLLELDPERQAEPHQVRERARRHRGPGRGDPRRPRERECRHLARPVRQSRRGLSRVREPGAPRGPGRGPEARGLPPAGGPAVSTRPRCLHRQQGRHRHQLRQGDGPGRDLPARRFDTTRRRVLHGRQARRPRHARLRRAPRGPAAVRKPDPVCLPARRHGARSRAARRAAVRARETSPR